MRGLKDHTVGGHHVRPMGRLAVTTRATTRHTGMYISAIGRVPPLDAVALRRSHPCASASIRSPTVLPRPSTSMRRAPLAIPRAAHVVAFLAVLLGYTRPRHAHETFSAS